MWVGSKLFLIEVESTADAAFAINEAGKICAWNKAAVELFGLTQAETVGVSCHEIVQCSDDKDTLCSDNCIIERTARDNSPLVNFDLRVKTKTGKVWCNLTTLIARDAISGERFAIQIVRPREMRKRLEQALGEFVKTQAKIGWDGAPVARTTAINVGLTTREVEVLKRMARGESTRVIAGQLSISSATVNNHIKHILTKLDAHTRLEAIRHAENVGVI